MTATRPQPEPYCQADPVFYDLAGRHDAHDDTVFPRTTAPVPDGWRRGDHDVWVMYTPTGHRLPEQGWKIHVSALPDNAGRVVDLTADHCLERGIPFKFLRSRSVLTTHSLKYAPRSASGKLVTIYPCDEDELLRTLEELGKTLDGEPGPYILTDLRWGDGPLHVRYGGFVARYCPTEDGTSVLAVRRPDGTLVPDSRRPVFEVPDWVTPPAFLGELMAARSGGAEEFPYRVERALHFSNAGGVYLARDTAGRQVILKEARPHAGLDGRGDDAVVRLARERRALERLAGLPGVPELYEHRTVWEHHFLAVEHLPGDTLQTWLARNYPLVRAGSTQEELDTYARRAAALADRVERIVRAVHGRGLVFGDLHPANILVDEDDRVHLVDFELAFPVEEADRLGLGHPGFAGTGRTGTAIDRHALAALRLWLLFPLTNLSELDPGRASRYADVAEHRFGLTPGSLDPLRRELAPAGPDRTPEALRTPAATDLAAPAPDWAAARRSMAEAVLLSATPERTDRLFPGSVRQFHTDGLNLAYGAAGVLWALDRAGAGRHPQHEEWLLRAVRSSPPQRAGLLDGAHGVAHVLAGFGHVDEALRLADDCRAAVAAMRATSLYGGLAGVGLTQLGLAHTTGRADLRDLALETAARLAENVRAGQAPGITAGPGRGSHAGLLHGWSGPALFYLRLYEETADRVHLDLAVRALHLDLDLCAPADDGSLQVDGGFRLLPYLDVGSAGIALVADQLLAHRADERIAGALPAIARAAEPEFTIEPHLFAGRAGLLATLAALSSGTACREPAVVGHDPLVARHLSRLHWHAMSYRGHLAFPGEQLRRLSMDLATGTAGVLLAVAAALDGHRDFLPFLAGPR
ncbi:class III lanthionine synthetase LanKC [Streptomyces sp. NBC_00525]|uniref:class III lanthionine synthetase LanKC n=1 Tax=Streptomyces sp. NBC_00525 TaxID=2903660 RepID=UPI002E811C62|nr:class III lanthionine synthetase LanKC [Streptomyces sp. NBC_00525]WUC94844.1 class III lanthionine synthetase LanKC [Streptomyces sp. NBC_00525]